MNENRLGDFRREFSSAAAGRQDLYTGLGLLALLLTLGPFALYHTRRDQLVLGVCVLAALLVANLAFIVYALLRGRQTIRYHANGLVFVKGAAREVVLWDDIEALRGCVPATWSETNTTIFLGGPMTIEMKDGRKVYPTFDTEDADALQHIIHDEVLKRLLPPALEAIEQGETLKFGPFEIDREGLTYKGQSLSWDALEKFSFTPDNLVVHQLVAKKPWADVRVDRVPNSNLLLELARRLRR